MPWAADPGGRLSLRLDLIPGQRAPRLAARPSKRWPAHQLGLGLLARAPLTGADRTNDAQRECRFWFRTAPSRWRGLKVRQTGSIGVLFSSEATGAEHPGTMPRSSW